MQQKHKRVIKEILTKSGKMSLKAEIQNAKILANFIKIFKYSEILTIKWEFQNSQIPYSDRALKITGLGGGQSSSHFIKVTWHNVICVYIQYVIDKK